MVDALLLVPGLMCDATVWEPVMPALQGRATCRVVAPADVDELAQMARLLLADAPAHFALAGHSMGARVALEVLRQAPERVSRIALLDTGYQARAVKKRRANGRPCSISPACKACAPWPPTGCRAWCIRSA